MNFDNERKYPAIYAERLTLTPNAKRLTLNAGRSMLSGDKW